MRRVIERAAGAAAFAAVIVLFAGGAWADAPRVAKAIPDNGDRDVDPNLKEIRIEFDQPMSRGGMSVCGGGENFPEIRGKPRWANERVFVMSVRLKPEHDYAFSINCPAARNFRSRSGESAEIYPIEFRTGVRAGPKGGRKLSRRANREAIAALRKAINQTYSYCDLRGVNWDKLLKEHDSKLQRADSPAAFARAAARMLENAKDVHVWLTVGDTRFATFRRDVRPNIDLSLVARCVPNLKRHSDAVQTGRFDDGVGYILITTWSPKSPSELEPAFDALAASAGSKGVVVDVRPNGGGNEELARQFAGCFVRSAQVYSRNCYRDATAKSGFSSMLDRAIEPNRGRPAFAGKVAVLMGPANMSSCESFLLMMRTSRRCRLFGERSYGSSGNPKPHELGNGVTVFLPSWKDFRPDGTLLEGNGVEPDVRVEPAPGRSGGRDRVLDAALKWIRE
ncbi:MAG: S41 family peptidase [Phycisphaerae bacterium]|nr:S41 family peptidase [Phycisphaerae bacterium]